MVSTAQLFLRTTANKSQIVRRTEDFDLLASEMTEKTPQEVEEYYRVFKQNWQKLSGQCY